jgi:hypothetical protein
MAGDTKRFRSFISYSQQDKSWGRRLHNWMETYRVPVGVVAQVEDGGRLGRFFRDEAEMPAASDIAEVVRDAIERAESLIVICSPRSAQSQWVAAEIAHFRERHPNGKVFAVIIDGVANSPDPATECFPPALRRSATARDAMPIEPVGVDVRVDSKDRICARLAAGLLDIDFDDLWQRDRRRAERRQRGAILTLSLTSAAFAALAIAASWFAVDAHKQRNLAQASRLDLQREYLTILGESAIDQVLTSDLSPGVLAATDKAAWVPLMRRDQQDFIIAREIDGGRVFAFAHDGLLDAARLKNGDAFLRRAVAWVRGPHGAKSVVVSSGHCEWMTMATQDWLLPGLLQSWGYQVTDAPGRLTDKALDGAGVLLIGNAWNDFQPEELDAIERFARRGGGVMLAGLGWSWLSDSGPAQARCGVGADRTQAPTLSAYPMNALGARFGVQWTSD